MSKKIDRLREYYDRTDTSHVLEEATPEEPDTSAVPMVTYALRLPRPVLDRLRDVAAGRGVKVSGLMRTWIEERLAREAAGREEVIAVEDLLALVAERAKKEDGPEPRPASRSGPQ